MRTGSETYDFSKLKQRWAREELERIDRSERMKSVLIEKGIPVLRKYGAHKVVLFGSVVSGNCTERSDMDVLALSIPNDLYWQCQHDLQEAVECFVDLYTQADDAAFVERLLSRGEVIYEART